MQSEQPSTGSDGLSGIFSVDDLSLPLNDSDNHEQLVSRDVKIKLCIEKEYVHVINIDHSRLADELANRSAMIALRNSTVDRRTTPATTTSRKMLTGESIRKLFRMMSPASHRRHQSADPLHSSGSSVSGDTLTGSKSSLAVDLQDKELPSVNSS